MEEAPGRPHLAIIPGPGIGHIIPLVEFSNRIIRSHGFSVTFISVSAGAVSGTQKAILDALPAPNATAVHLPPVDLSDLPPCTKIETRISLTVRRSLPRLRDVLSRLRSTTRLLGLVFDFFAADAIDAASELGLPAHAFISFSALVFSILFHLPELDARYSCEFRDVPEPIVAPGCIPLHGSELLDPLQDRKDEAYEWMLCHGRRHRLAKGIILNCVQDVEPTAIKALKEMGGPTLYPVGPLIRSCSGRHEDEACLRWLNEQPRGSVLYVSFGSGGTLSSEQTRELALGLEQSEHRFLWVARSPHEEAANGTYFTARSSRDPFAFLPDGFVDRTKGTGLVVPSWVPQVEILAHGSTGGFLSHCGWNSTLEGIAHGVPIIAWPLFAEQKMNAVLLTEELKVSLRPKSDGGLVGREEVARVVKALMEGEEGKAVRSRMRYLKDAASRAFSDDGSSSQALNALAGVLTGMEAVTKM